MQHQMNVLTVTGT